MNRELDHPRTSRQEIFPVARCPKCKGRLTGTEFGTTRELRCIAGKNGCGYVFDENVKNARGERRGR